jgi:Ca2+-binding EF-hand superfamily protein
MPIADIDYREYLTEEEITNITDAFNNIDTMKSGSIGEKELSTMFKSLGHQLSRKQLLEIINEVDFDGSGSIELEEFYVMNIKLNKLWPRPDLINCRDYFLDVKVRHVQVAFEQCDPEGKGWIDEADFVDHVLEHLQLQPSEQFLDAVLKQAIPDGSGRLDFERCCNCIVTLSQARKIINYREFLSSKEVEHYRKLFITNDSNNDGSVSMPELDRMLQRIGFTLKPKQLKSAIKDFDINESGEIDFEEFSVMMCRMLRKRRQRIISPETCTCRDLYREEHFTVKELFLGGFKLADLKRAGVSVREIRMEGVGALEFRRAGYTPAELRRAGVNLVELRSCGFSLADLRLAGFSDGSVSEANRTLRSSISVGNLALLPQCNPMSSRMIYGPKDALKSLPVTHPLRLMTPLIRGHTDWNVFPDPPRKPSLAAAGASMLGASTMALLEDDSPRSPLSRMVTQ